MLSSRNLLWGVFVVFVACALFFGWHDRLFAFDQPMGAGKLVVWACFAGFLAYSIHCSSRENLFRSVAEITELLWGRQICADLYLGLLLAMGIIYLNEGFVAALLWLVPTLLFANLSILLYAAIHFDSIVSRFMT
jgi:hypothetical protein